MNVLIRSPTTVIGTQTALIYLKGLTAHARTALMATECSVQVFIVLIVYVIGIQNHGLGILYELPMTLKGLMNYHGISLKFLDCNFVKSE